MSCRKFIHFVALVIALVSNNPAECQFQPALSWVENLKSFFENQGIDEVTPRSTLFGSLQAQSLESKTVSYFSNRPEIFIVDETTGRVWLNRKVDAEVEQQFSVTFTARDQDGAEITENVRVKVNDFNDNFPIFENTPYVATVAESALPGTHVYGPALITDADVTFFNNALRVVCGMGAETQEDFDACSKFELQTPSGTANSQLYFNITAVGPFNRATKSSYSLPLKAEDGQGGVVTTRVLITVMSGPAQDLPATSIFENRPTNQEVYSLVFNGPSAGNNIRFSISRDPRGLFKLGTSTRRNDGSYSVPVLVAQTIDREVVGESYQIIVQAVDVINSTHTGSLQETSIDFTIRDLNDNAPVFSSPVYSYNLSEQAGTIGNQQISITDPDVGSNSVYEMFIQDFSSGSVRATDALQLAPSIGEGTTSVRVNVVDSRYLDYELRGSNSFQFQIVARETETQERRSSTATITLMVTNANDHMPEFSIPEYRFLVREDRQPGFPIGRVQATDQDIGVFGQITYSLAGTTSFRIHNTTGEVFLTSTLDFEVQQLFNALVTATDGGGQQTTNNMRILVVDSNDQGPVFTVDQYETTVQESSTVLQPPITVQATDADSEFPVTYRIISGNPSGDPFVIDSVTGVITLNRPIDFQETPSMTGIIELIVEGSDNGVPQPQTAVVPIRIVIRDENNNAPRFGQAIYRRTINELTPPDTAVLTVDASDLDAGQNAELEFIISQGSRDDFVIGLVTGVIRVAPTRRLDVDIRRNYAIQVLAIDRGSPRQTGTATALITVTDANNKPPTFTQQVYRFDVAEDTPVTSPIGMIAATDPDSTSNLVYEIIPGSLEALDRNRIPLPQEQLQQYVNLFNVNPSNGDIIIGADLTTNTLSEVSFDIRVRDVNAEQPADQIATATVIISITRGDTGIEFIPPWSQTNPIFNITVVEGEPANTEIMRLVASDPQTQTPIIDYREVQGSDVRDAFNVDRLSGAVTLNRVLNYDLLPTPELTFQVQAFSIGPDVRSALATIRVTVLDINDNVPTFDQNTYVFIIDEDRMYPTVVGQVRATDGDSGSFGNVVYTLTGQGSDFFFINGSTGEIYIKPNVTLDRETINRFNLLVTATDDDGNGQSTTVQVTITLRDVNDVQPTFSSLIFDVNVLEATPPQRSIAQITARDTDEGRNGDVEYTIENQQDLFNIETNTGVIRTSMSLVGRAGGSPYELTIRAQDQGLGTPLSSTALVRVYVNLADATIVTPVVIFPEDEEIIIVIPENSEDNNVTQIQGRKRVGTGTIKYTFLQNPDLQEGYNKFQIDPDTGLITIRCPDGTPEGAKCSLDYEEGGLYELIIVIEDDDGNQVTRKIIVNVTNTNDNEPTFIGCPGFPISSNGLSASVFENQPAGQPLVTVQACDADGPENAPIYYAITGGNMVDAFYSNQPPFFIFKENGTVVSNVMFDREHVSRYTITITATNTDPGVTGKRRKRQAEAGSGGSIDVVINILDVDDNGPKFGVGNMSSGSEVTTGILNSEPFNSDVYQLRAVDADPSANTLTYSITETKFYSDRNVIQNTPNAFSIDPESGMLRTRRSDYLEFVDGHFELVITVRDDQNRSASSRVNVYVSRESQRLRFIYTRAVRLVQEAYARFLVAWDDLFLPLGVETNPDSLRYHVDEDGGLDESRTDVCFHMVKDKRVLNADVAEGIISDRRLDEEEGFRDLQDDYGYQSIDLCSVRVDGTWKWSGYWWLWWLLIAQALFMFLVTLIVLIILCCCCWPAYYQTTKSEKPYIVLDPVVPGSEYEWQKEEIHM